MAQAKQDMGSGSVKKLMLQLMIPAVVAQVVNLLYNIVDRIYIGHIAGIGAAALTGVGLFTPILMLLNAFAMLVGAGGAPRTAIALGQGDKEQAEKIISNSFTMLLLFSVVLTVVFYAGAPTLLRLFGASDATLPYALAYSRIYILGSVFVLLVLGMNPFITTQGFAKTSMLTTVIGAVINIILDPILIFGLGLGVRGAAIATVLSQAVGAAWILHFLTGKKTILRLRDQLISTFIFCKFFLVTCSMLKHIFHSRTKSAHQALESSHAILSFFKFLTRIIHSIAIAGKTTTHFLQIEICLANNRYLLLNFRINCRYTLKRSEGIVKFFKHSIRGTYRRLRSCRFT